MLGIIGASSFLAFSPFNFKLLLVLTHAFLFHSVFSSNSLLGAFKRSIAWGLGYWLGGAGWLIVSIHYYGNTSIYIAFIIIVLMACLLSLVFIGPICFLKLVGRTNNFLTHSILCAGVLTIIELLRFFLFGGFPWLLPGLIFTDTIGQDLIPILGVYGGSFIIYFVSLLIASSYQNKNYARALISICFLIVFYPHPGYNNPPLKDGMKIAIIQPSLDPFKKYAEASQRSIEDTLVDLSNLQADVDLLIWPESPLPYKNSSQQMRRLLQRTNEYPMILSGGWEEKNGNLQNVMGILGSDVTYAKRHLVIFGEYIPFESFFRGIIEFFDMPMSNTTPGKSNQDMLSINGKQILGLICFDVAFPLSFINKAKTADFIVNISNDSWFGSSYGPYQHLQIVRARALELNKWIARGTSDGISTIVDNKGTIVSKLDKGSQGVLLGTIYIQKKESYFVKYGYLIVPILSFILMLLSFILRLREYLSSLDTE
jgi:apolipoprotein N-acyltransferase